MVVVSDCVGRYIGSFCGFYVMGGVVYYKCLAGWYLQLFYDVVEICWMRFEWIGIWISVLYDVYEWSYIQGFCNLFGKVLQFVVVNGGFFGFQCLQGIYDVGVGFGFGYKMFSVVCVEVCFCGVQGVGVVCVC